MKWEILILRGPRKLALIGHQGLMRWFMLVIQFADLAAANFLHSIHPAKVAEANSANAVLAGQVCSAKTANS